MNVKEDALATITVWFSDVKNKVEVSEVVKTALKLGSKPHFMTFKSNKLASTNLNNMLYSLSYHMSKDNPPVFLSTFEDFLMARL